MKALITYLTFDGKCREAMTFYSQCLEADLQLFPWSAAPPEYSGQANDRIMHATLTKESATLMASDSMPGTPLHPGDNCSVSIACESKEEIEKLFSAFADKGHVKMALQDTFWGARFGMLTDQFGIHWMFNYDYPK